MLDLVEDSRTGCKVDNNFLALSDPEEDEISDDFMEEVVRIVEVCVRMVLVRICDEVVCCVSIDENKVGRDVVKTIMDEGVDLEVEIIAKAAVVLIIEGFGRAVVTRRTVDVFGDAAIEIVFGGSVIDGVACPSFSSCMFEITNNFRNMTVTTFKNINVSKNKKLIEKSQTISIFALHRFFSV
jgi:hypothetical protein